MARRATSAFCLLLFAVVFARSSSAASSTKPNDREWGLLTADYQWLETLRKAQGQPPAANSKQAADVVRRVMGWANGAAPEVIHPTPGPRPGLPVQHIKPAVRYAGTAIAPIDRHAP